MGGWRDGRRAWERLEGWEHDAPGGRDRGAAALSALADIGLIQRLLDRAELVSVRTARRHGKSWTEIATELGVTRQSAWERWRDLDDSDAPETSAPGSAVPPAPAARRRRRSSVEVPNVVGLSWDGARWLLHNAGLRAIGPDPDGPPLDIDGPGGVVTDQTPEAGARVPAGSPVTLWFGGDGGSGVREPRRPRPAPRSGRALGPQDEAVG